MKYYALYKGEEVITHGTLIEIAEQTGKSLSNLRWMKSPTSHKRANLGKNRQRLVEVEANG